MSVGTAGAMRTFGQYRWSAKLGVRLGHIIKLSFGDEADRRSHRTPPVCRIMVSHQPEHEYLSDGIFVAGFWHDLLASHHCHSDRKRPGKHVRRAQFGVRCSKPYRLPHRLQKCLGYVMIASLLQIPSDNPLQECGEHISQSSIEF